MAKHYGFYADHHYLGDGDGYPGDALIDAANEAIDLRAENVRLRELLYQALTEGEFLPADYGVSLNHDTGQAFLLDRKEP